MTISDFPVVALVCSHGGLDALIHVLSPLHTDFPAAVIVLKHHNPDTESMLAEILARHTAMPVSWARDGAIDHVLAVNDIAKLLMALAAQ